MSLFLLGSYSGPISLWRLLKSGEFEFVRLVPGARSKGTKSPSWICSSQCGKFVYCVNEGEESLSSYQCEYQENELQDLILINTSASGGIWPCHFAVSDGSVIVANYGSGTLSLIPVGSDGRILQPAQVIDQNMHSRNASQVSHVHQVVQSHVDSPDIFHVCDLGLDLILTYRLSQPGESVQTSSLTLLDSYSLPSGSGPRHMVMHPNGSHAYVVNELSNTVCVLQVNRTTRLLSAETANQLDQLQIQSCLPSGTSATEGTMGAAILLSKNSRFLYISNRCIENTADTASVVARSTVTVFSVSADGAKIEQIQSVCTQGIHPRHMCLTSDDSRLCVANKVSSSLVTFNVDAESGRIDESSAVVTDCKSNCPDPNFMLEIR